MLQALETQTSFVAQMAADVAALKIVLCSLDGRAQGRLEQQVAITSGKFQSIVEANHRDIETLRQLIFQLPTPKPN